MSGLLPNSPAEILQQALVDDLLGSQPNESDIWPIFVNNNQKSNTENITVYDTTGIVRGKTHVDSEVQEHYGLQFLIRHPDPPVCYQKANELMVQINTIWRKIVILENLHYSIDAITTSGPILRVGKEQPEEVLFVYSLNAIASIRLLP
jgi:hypothetical protein